jgi:hypothetical protein
MGFEILQRGKLFDYFSDWPIRYASQPNPIPIPPYTKGNQESLVSGKENQNAPQSKYAITRQLHIAILSNRPFILDP